MEPNSSSHNQTVDLTRPPPDYPSPSTSGVNSSNSQQEVTTESSSNETQNAPETLSNTDSRGNATYIKMSFTFTFSISFLVLYFQFSDNSTPIVANSAIKSQSLLTPSKIFSVLSKPSVLIQGTQTLESRKHKAEPNRAELPHEKRFKSSSSGTSEEAHSSTGTTTASDASEVLSPTTQEQSAIVENQRLNSTTFETIGRSTSHKNFQVPGSSSAFIEPIKTRSAQEKRLRSTDDQTNYRNEITSHSEDQSQTTASTRVLPSDSSSTSGISNSIQKPPNSPEQPREKRFKSSDSTDSLAEAGNSSNSSSNSQPLRSFLTSRNPGRYYLVNFNQLKPPPSYNSATANASSSQVQRNCSFRIRIPLERETNGGTTSSETSDTGR